MSNGFLFRAPQFKVGKGGEKAGFRVMLKHLEIKKSFIFGRLFCYYIKQIDSMLPCVCSVIDHEDVKMW